jgi:hypothetical protein
MAKLGGVANYFNLYMKVSPYTAQTSSKAPCGTRYDHSVELLHCFFASKYCFRFEVCGFAFPAIRRQANLLITRS